MLDEYRRLAKMDQLPVKIQVDPDNDEKRFKCVPVGDSWYFRYCNSGSDYAGLLASVAWIKEGPKIVDVTEEQYQALSQVEVRLEVKDFHMPYPTILINMPPGRMHSHVILHKYDNVESLGGAPPTSILIGASMSDDHQHDIINIVRQLPGNEIEKSLGRFYGEVSQSEAEETHPSLRVACNMVLAMTNFGCQSSYLFPTEVEREKKYIRKGDRAGRDGRNASDRLKEQPIIVQLDRNVKLWHREGGHKDGDGTNRQQPFHWRRGHWRNAHVGKGRAERRLVFVRPCMVHAELLQVGPDETSTSYES